MFSGACASTTGSDHIKVDKPNQDGAYYFEFQRGSDVYRIGYVLDGCSSGDMPDLGVRYARRFIKKTIVKALEDQIGLDQIPALILQNIVSELIPGLCNLLAQDDDEACLEFIADDLLFTLLGFIQGPNEVVVFVYGDGVVQINDFVDLRYLDDRSDYVAYLAIMDHLTDGRSLPKQCKIWVIPTQLVDKVACFTDSWIEEQSLIPLIWGEDFTWSPYALQFWLNTWATLPIPSRRWNRTHFRDDGSVAILRRL